MRIRLLLTLTLALNCMAFLSAQSVDDTQLKQVIIFGRHSVRSPVTPDAMLNTFSVQPYPTFSAAPVVPPAQPAAVGYLTVNGAALETILGGYYRQWLTSQGLLTGNDAADAANVYFHANTLERTILTAQAFWSGLLPGAGAPNVDVSSQASDPLFNPVGAGVATLDPQRAVAAVNGRLGSNAQSIATSYAPEIALARSLLLGYPNVQNLRPPAPAGVTDVAETPIAITAGSPVAIPGLDGLSEAIDPFLMEYADGMSMSQVGWGQLTASGVGQLSRLYNLDLDLACRTPYLARVESSNLASHVVRSLAQAAGGAAVTGSLGTPSTRVIALIGSDTQISALASLFHLDWLLPGYPPDFAAPGGALVLELRQSQSTNEYVVRASYIAQTFDQLRNLTPLSAASPPAIAPVFIPGCSTSDTTFDCPLKKFILLAKEVIDPQFADTVH